MAKMMKRVTALVLALVLVASQLAIPTRATEGPSNPEATLTVTPAAPETTTTTDTTTDPNTGAVTTTTTTTTKDPGTSTTSTTTTTTTEQTDVTNGGAHVETSRTENSSTTTTTGPIQDTVPGKPGESDTEKSTTTTTQTESSSSSTGVLEVTPVGPNAQQVSQSETGSGSSLTTETTTTTEVTENVATGTLPTDPGTPAPNKVPGSDKDSKPVDLNDDSIWTDGTSLNNQTGWVDGKPVEGSILDSGTNPTQKLDNVQPDENLKNDANVEINVVPDNQWYSATNVLTTQDLRNGEVPAIWDPAKYAGYTLTETRQGKTLTGWVGTDPATGNTVTIAPHYNADGKRDGWTVTTVTESQHSDRTTVTPKGQTETETGVVSSITSTPRVDPSMEALIENQTKNGPQVKKIDDNTNEITTYTRIYDTDGKTFLGYRTTVEKVTVSSPVTSSAPIDPALASQFADKDVDTKQWLELPTNVPTPVSDQDNGDGTVTTIEVQPIQDQTGSDYTKKGDVVGYEITTVIKDKDGNELSKVVQEVYGTAITKTTTTIIDPTTLETITTDTTTERKIDDIYTSDHTRQMGMNLSKTDTYQTKIVTENDIYQLVDTDQGMFFVYEGKMSQVVGTATLMEDHNLVGATVKKDANGNVMFDENGNVILENTTVPLTGENMRLYPDFTKNYSGQTPGWNGTYNGANGEYVKIGTNLYGGVLTWDDNEGRHTPQQYMIYDGENVRFVYCIELNTPAATGSYYASDRKDEESTSAPWNNASGAIYQISAVATHGFWGTTEGIGSLQAVKDLLTKHGMSEVAGRMTEGMAQAATQLAMWEFGHTSNGVGFTEEYINGVAQGNYVTWNDATNAAPTDQFQQDIAALRNLLIDLANEPVEDRGNKQLTADSITGGQISVKEKSYDSNGNVKSNGTNEAFNTDVEFRLDLNTALSGDLVLEIQDPATGDVIYKCRLAGDPKNSIFDGFTNTVRPDAYGNYRLENVELFENQPITLNLKGIQYLDDGVYIYSNKGQQDFVGLSTKKSEANLSFNLEFRVTDPEFTHTKESAWAIREDSITSTATAQRLDTAVSVTTHYHEENETQQSKTRTIRSTITKVVEEKKLTKEEIRWNTYYAYLMSTLTGDDMDPTTGNGGGRNAGITIPDEAVPLAAAPQTGDNTLLLAAICILSLMGAAALSLPPKKKEA